MGLEERAQHFKEKYFKGRTVSERYDNLLLNLRSFKSRKQIYSNEINTLKNIIINEDLPVDHPVNEYLKKLVEVWCNELFEVIIVKETPKVEVKEDTGEKVVVTENGEELVIDDDYDPDMLALAGEHPDEYSVEVLREEIARGDGSDE